MAIEDYSALQQSMYTVFHKGKMNKLFLKTSLKNKIISEILGKDGSRQSALCPKI